MEMGCQNLVCNPGFCHFYLPFPIDILRRAFYNQPVSGSLRNCWRGIMRVNEGKMKPLLWKKLTMKRKTAWGRKLLQVGLLGALCLLLVGLTRVQGHSGRLDGAQVQLPTLISYYFPYVNRDQTYTVTGKIIDENHMPVAGIVVKADNVLAAVTGADGVYVLGELKSGSYIFTPQNSNRYYYSPMSQTLNITGNTSGVNFMAMPSGGEYINNGSFEDNTAWEINTTPVLAAFSTRGHHSGLRSMQIGIFDTTLNSVGVSKFRQMVPIPNHISSANLTFWMYTSSNETFNTDYQNVYILDSNGKALGYALPNQRANDKNWVMVQYDLTQFAGKYISVVFSVYNDGINGITNMLIDDVSVSIVP